MKQYFMEITCYSTKNKAHEELQEFARRYHHCLVNEPSLKQIKARFEEKMNQVNAAHPRCRNIELSGWKHQYTQTIAIEGNFILSVKEIKRTENKPAMKAIKFHVGIYHYAYAAKTFEEARQALAECLGEVIIDRQEEIPSDEWDKKFITIHEDNDLEAEAFQVSILDLMAGEEPQLLFTNDWSLIS